MSCDDRCTPSDPHHHHHETAPPSRTPAHPGFADLGGPGPWRVYRFTSSEYKDQIAYWESSDGTTRSYSPQHGRLIKDIERRERSHWWNAPFIQFVSGEPLSSTALAVELNGLSLTPQSHYIKRDGADAGSICLDEYEFDWNYPDSGADLMRRSRILGYTDEDARRGVSRDGADRSAPFPPPRPAFLETDKRFWLVRATMRHKPHNGVLINQYLVAYVDGYVQRAALLCCMLAGTGCEFEAFAVSKE